MHEKLRVLLIEDNEDHASLIAALLRQKETARTRLEHVRTLQEGLAAVESAEKDAVILDLDLPDSCGLDTVDAMRLHAPDVAVVVMSALDDDELAMNAVQLGAQDYLCKQSITSEVLTRSVRYAIERKKIEREIRDKNRDLEEANRYKTQFFANMSHELKSPLNSILVLSKLIQSSNAALTNEQRGWIRLIHESGSDLLALIDGLLDLAKIEAGRMDIELQDVCVRDLVESVQEMYLAVAREKSVELKTTIHDSAPANLRTDGQKAKQILKNLVSNALKFTPHGSVIVEVSGMPAAEEAVARAGGLSVRVKDTGIGIASSQLERVFEPFAQEDGTTSRNYGGTGLGLSISLELAQMLGGTLTVESEKGRGSEFTLRLPSGSGEAGGRDATGTEAGAPQSELGEPLQKSKSLLVRTRGKTAVVVTPDMRMAYVVTSVLESMGMAVRARSSGQSVLAEISQVPSVDYLLVDVEDASGEGGSLVDRISTCELSRETRVVLLTGKHGEGRFPARTEQVIAHVERPVTPRRLLEALRKA